LRALRLIRLALEEAQNHRAESNQAGVRQEQEPAWRRDRGRAGHPRPGRAHRGRLHLGQIAPGKDMPQFLNQHMLVVVFGE